ncbi:hypothetical protein PIB30_056403 [Stylosanthes scabra]|uniref:Ubiquitin-like protease family profile domain-containing protein n=1 Tax=Stylosanthes scabra TaxID=79078 RepID=A0ABU6XK19_9FABA|nr:hypothetical protein [Stylosanthes scabra]
MASQDVRSGKDEETEAILAAVEKLNDNPGQANKNMINILKVHETESNQIEEASGHVKQGMNLLNEVVDWVVRKRCKTVSPGILLGSDVTSPVKGSQRDSMKDAHARGKGKKVMGVQSTATHTNVVGNSNDTTIMFEPMLHDDMCRNIQTTTATKVTVRKPSQLSAFASPSERDIPRLGERPSDLRTPGKLRRLPREQRPRMSNLETGFTLPPFIRSCLPITPKMDLSYAEMQYVAYIFGESLNPNEVLFRRGEWKLEREEFNCLHPGKEPSTYILDLMAYKTTWTQPQLSKTEVWSLPLLFSDLCVTPGFEMDDIIQHFSYDWLPTPDGLKYVYVQMKDVIQPDVNHYYLMVVDITRTKIHIFDCFPNEAFEQRRKDAAKDVARVLDRILRVNFEGVGVLTDKPPMEEWEPSFVLGVPNMSCW